MDKSPAAQALLSLAKENAGRTKAARLREVFDEIETAQRAGVSNAKIVETLNEQGFDLTLKTFETMLYRIRKKQRQATASSAGRSHDEPTPPTPSTTPETRKVGSFEIPKPKRFVHTAKPDDDLLK